MPTMYAPSSSPSLPKRSSYLGSVTVRFSGLSASGFRYSKEIPRPESLASLTAFLMSDSVKFLPRIISVSVSITGADESEPRP